MAQIAFSNQLNRTTANPLETGVKFDNYQQVQQYWLQYGTFYIPQIISIQGHNYQFYSLPNSVTTPLSDYESDHLKMVTAGQQNLETNYPLFEIDEDGYLIENIQNADYPYSFGVDEISGQLYIET